MTRLPLRLVVFLKPILENYQTADGHVTVPNGAAALHGRHMLEYNRFAYLTRTWL